MSTTNPTGHPPADPVGGLAPVEPGSPPADDHDAAVRRPPETIARGYEETATTPRASSACRCW